MAGDAATAGFFIGGSLGAIIAYYIARKRQGEGQQDDEAMTERCSIDIAHYKHINADGALRTALTAPIALFATLDRPETLGLLQNYDDLGAAYAQCLGGNVKPSVMAKALAARRLAANRLANFVRKSRQERPIPASDLAEDFVACKKFLDDYLYNINQEQGLHRLNAKAS